MPMIITQGIAGSIYIKVVPVDLLPKGLPTLVRDNDLIKLDKEYTEQSAGDLLFMISCWACCSYA